MEHVMFSHRRHRFKIYFTSHHCHYCACLWSGLFIQFQIETIRKHNPINHRKIIYYKNEHHHLFLDSIFPTRLYNFQHQINEK